MRWRKERESGKGQTDKERGKSNAVRKLLLRRLLQSVRGLDPAQDLSAHECGSDPGPPYARGGLGVGHKVSDAQYDKLRWRARP